jgi:hypothetical protein
MGSPSLLPSREVNLMSHQLKARVQSFIGDVIDEFLKLAMTVPPDRWTWRPGPTASSAQEIVWHVALGLHFTAPSLRGEKPTPPDEQWLAQFKERYATQESLKAFIQENLRELWFALDRLEDLAQVCTGEIAGQPRKSYYAAAPSTRPIIVASSRIFKDCWGIRKITFDALINCLLERALYNYRIER